MLVAEDSRAQGCVEPRHDHGRQSGRDRPDGVDDTADQLWTELLSFLRPVDRIVDLLLESGTADLDRL